MGRIQRRELLDGCGLHVHDPDVFPCGAACGYGVGRVEDSVLTPAQEKGKADALAVCRRAHPVGRGGEVVSGEPCERVAHHDRHSPRPRRALGLDVQPLVVGEATHLKPGALGMHVKGEEAHVRVLVAEHVRSPDPADARNVTACAEEGVTEPPRGVLGGVFLGGGGPIEEPAEEGAGHAQVIGNRPAEEGRANVLERRQRLLERGVQAIDSTDDWFHATFDPETRLVAEGRSVR